MIKERLDMILGRSTIGCAAPPWVTFNWDDVPNFSICLARDTTRENEIEISLTDKINNTNCRRTFAAAETDEVVAFVRQIASPSTLTWTKLPEIVLDPAKLPKLRNPGTDKTIE